MTGTGAGARTGGREDEYGDEHEGIDEGEHGTGNRDGNERQNGDEYRDEGGEEEILRTYEVVIEVGRKTREGGRPDAPARPSHHAKDQSAWTGGEGQDQGGRRRGEEAQETPQEL